MRQDFTHRLAFVRVSARPLPRSRVPPPLVVSGLLGHHETSRDGQLELGWPKQCTSTAPPPQGVEGGVTLKHAQRLLRLTGVQAQALTKAHVEEAVAGHPLPQHKPCRLLTAVQYQVGPVQADAAVELNTLQDESTFT